MTQQRRTALKELQKLDVSILNERQKIRDFDPLFAEVEEPALILEGELNTSRNRLKEMESEERRLERSTEEKRERIKRLEERSGKVRNLREEAAVSAELDMVRRSLQNDEQEAMSLIDHIRKGEERVAEIEGAFAEASELVEPKKAELLEQRERAKQELARLEGERERFTAGMDPEELRIYDAIRSGGSRAAVAELTEDGACGNCFGMVPLQNQNEVRHGQTLIRCEACGVILAAADPKPAEEEKAPAGDDVSETETEAGVGVDPESAESEPSPEAEASEPEAGPDGEAAELETAAEADDGPVVPEAAAVAMGREEAGSGNDDKE